jgi:uracil-DNA glycosylase family 4
MKMDWTQYKGKYVKVAQEVLMDNIWSELEFEGWVARVEAGTLVMDNGEEWAVEDEFVRSSRLLPSLSKGMPAWQRSPGKWIQVEEGWERTPVSPKLEGCNCSNCSLYDNILVDDDRRTEKCDILFVGEAPGWEEARSDPQRFFVGKSGQLLDALIEQTGLSKFKVGLNNTCICYGSDTPTDEDIRACNSRLLREISQAEPKIIVAVGGVALQALAGLKGITEYQGMFMDWEYEEDITLDIGEEQEETVKGRRKVKLLPCFHAAAVLRRPDLFYTFAETIYKASLYLQGDKNLDIQLDDFDIRVVQEELPILDGDDPLATDWGVASLEGALQVLRGAEKLYIDLETTNYSPYKDDIICISISYRVRGKASRSSYVFPWELIEKHFIPFKELIESKPSDYWNAFFDAQFLRQHGIRPIKVGDIMLKHYTLDETPFNQSLKGNARYYCNAPDWEAPLKSYLPTKATSFSAIPKRILYPYNGYDSGYTAVLDDEVSARMDSHNWEVYNRILVPALEMFLDTCDVGMIVDLSRMEELRQELTAKLEDYRALLAQMAGEESFNPSSIRDARHLVYDILGLNTGSTSTSRTALEDYKGVEGVDLLLSYRETRKLLGTYVEGLADDLVGDVVHPNVRLNGTVTGRLSSANPNFFGIPDEKGGIKKLYKARYPGWGIGDGDGAQMEIRVLGALSNDPNLIRDFRTGVDFHGAARNRLFGRGTAKSNYTHQEVLDAKTAVFGPIYGRGAVSLAQQFYHSELATLREKGQEIEYATWDSLPERWVPLKSVDIERSWRSLPKRGSMLMDPRVGKGLRIVQAQEHIDKLWEPYPVALAWLEENVQRGQQDGELMSYYGRYRHWGLITEDNIEDIKTQGRNYPVQSPSSDTNLLVMIGSYHTFPREIYIPIFPVHDAVVFMYKLGCEGELIPQLKEYFEKTAAELLQSEMKFEYSFTIGPNWGEQKEWKNA